MQELVKWKDRESRRSLVLQGARQIGNTVGNESQRIYFYNPTERSSEDGYLCAMSIYYDARKEEQTFADIKSELKKLEYT